MSRAIITALGVTCGLGVGACSIRIKPVLSPNTKPYIRINIISGAKVRDNSKNSPARAIDGMPEAFVSNAAISGEVSRRVADGRLRKLASRLYTRNLEDSPADIVRRNLWDIVAGYFPGALIADRTAFELQPAADGSVCVVSARGADIVLPGVVLRPRRGAKPGEDDRPFMNGRLHLSSPARAYLDNLYPSRARGRRLPRTLSRMEVEERVERLMASAGIDACNRLREDARHIAQDVHRTAQLAQFDAIIGAISGTRDAQLSAPTARARARGRPYDPARIVLFEDLFSTLGRMPPSSRRPAPRDGIGNATLAFFEAYFSNYIEGTEFEVEEAADIVFQGRIPPLRPADAHDILGVWRLVSDPSAMRLVPETANDLVDILRERHGKVLSGRPEASPGRFKTKPNRVGSTVFVAPDAILGTLDRGFDIYRGLDAGFHRAVFMHFMVSEIHPFADGNGRLARIMMNAELVAANEERLVIPIVYRDNYIAAQRALSLGHTAEALVRMMDFAWRWTAAINWGPLAQTEERLRACNAFDSEAVAENKGLRLALPSPTG